MPHACELCHSNVASVFTNDHPLCRSCHREVQRNEREDNATPNRPSCAGCGQPEHGDLSCLRGGVLVVSQ